MASLENIRFEGFFPIGFSDKGVDDDDDDEEEGGDTFIPLPDDTSDDDDDEEDDGDTLPPPDSGIIGPEYSIPGFESGIGIGSESGIEGDRGSDSGWGELSHGPTSSAPAGEVAPGTQPDPDLAALEQSARARAFKDLPALAQLAFAVPALAPAKLAFTEPQLGTAPATGLADVGPGAPSGGTATAEGVLGLGSEVGVAQGGPSPGGYSSVQSATTGEQDYGSASTAGGVAAVDSGDPGAQPGGWGGLDGGGGVSGSESTGGQTGSAGADSLGGGATTGAGRGADPSADTGQGGGGAGGGGGKIICGELYRQGKLPPDIYEADAAYGRMIRASDPALYAGYIAWAPYVVAAMRAPVIGSAATLAISWLALPWARRMAGEHNVVGTLLTLIGEPLCRAIGHFNHGDHHAISVR